MRNFELFLPTKYIFGKGQVEKVGAETARYGKTALVVSGKGSAKGSGLLDKVVELLSAQGIAVHQLSGVNSNPRLSSCVEGARICREKGVTVVVSVGGGSVLDASKTVAVLALDDGDPWDFFTGKRPIAKALPIVDVITVAATGSEYGPFAVVTNEKTREKLGTFGEQLLPRVSIVDPTYTFTVPRNHTVFGSIDIISHHLEAYIQCEYAPLMQDEFTEAVVRAVIENTERVLVNPEDYDARAALMWANTLACGVFMRGRGAMRFDGHTIEHELSAAYDCSHGAGLAVILPGVMRHVAEKNPARIARLARTVLGLGKDARMGDRELALAGVKAFQDWFRKVGAPVTLAQLGVKKEMLRTHAVNIAKSVGADLSVETVLKIFSYVA